MAERRNRITSDQTLALSNAFNQLPVDLYALLTPHERQQVIELSRTHGLSAYDAAYLELAMRLAVPLATIDARLAAAARAVGVSLAPEQIG